MSFHPMESPTRHAPTKVAAGTYVIHEVQHALGQPLSVYLNSLVIQAAEPVIVDTGTVRNRRAWLEDVFGLVDPADVRWVFLSHDDADHTGNLAEVMAACPKAQLVCSWAITERFANAFAFPLERCRWLNDGDTFEAGDRTLMALRPPLYDSPATRGLLDQRTRVYWAADSSPPPSPAARALHRWPQTSPISTRVLVERDGDVHPPRPVTVAKPRGPRPLRQGRRPHPGPSAHHHRVRPQPRHHRRKRRSDPRSHPPTARRGAPSGTRSGRARPHPRRERGQPRTHTGAVNLTAELGCS
jgi:hypothetical protein